MKGFWFSYLITLILGLVLLSLFLWFIYPTFIKSVVAVSPVPDFLSLSSNRQVSTLSLWLPEIFASSALSNEPDISAVSALTYDLTTQKTLFEKKPNKKLAMASLTKIMTAIIALENPKPDDKYSVPGEALVGEDSMGLAQGEVLSLSDLMYGLILHSANDAAETLAYNYPTGRTGFINAMNDKVKSLGLTDTHFTNPSGLEGDGNQYTTAHDLLIITDYALSNFPLFDKVAATFDYTIPYSLTHKAYYLENETNLLTSYPGVKGVKTGYTPEAGLCLVTYLEYKGHKIIGILLGSDNRRSEMKDLLDYSLTEEKVIPPPHS